MRRRTDIIMHWPCAHPCSCTEEAIGAVRYAAVWKQAAFALTVSEVSGQFALHRAFSVPLAPERPSGIECDLLGKRCVIECDFAEPTTREVMVSMSSAGEAPRPCVSLVSARPVQHPALVWWAAHAVQGRLEQPESFWKALEAMGRSWMRKERRKLYPEVRCPYCGQRATIRTGR